MKKKMVNWFKEHRVLRAALPSVLALLLVAMVFIPYAQADITYLDVEGTYAVNSTIGAKYLDGANHAPMVGNTLTITTQADQVISSASLTMFGDTVDLTGLVGSGSRPWISLTGDDGTDTYLSITGRILSGGGVVKGISGGMITGYTISEGHKWEDGDDSTAATYTGANAYEGSGYCALLTADSAGDPEVVAVIFHQPQNTFKLSQLDTLAASTRNGLGFYYRASQTTKGPQFMMRFAPAGSTGSLNMSYWGGGTTSYVDITIMPLQSGAVSGSWTKYTVTGDSAICGYYGTAPDDFASFDGGWSGENYTLAEIEAAINAETQMTNGTAATCGNWVLTIVDVELYESGTRTCYIDNIQIGRYTYTLEPYAFSCAFKARISD